MANRRAVFAERGIQQRRAGEPRRHAVPAAQARLGAHRCAEQVHVVGREPETALVLGHRPLVVDRVHVSVVVAEGEVDRRILGPEPARALGGEPRLLAQRGVRHAVGVERAPGAGELSPGLHEGGVEADRALVVPDGAPEAGLIRPHPLCRRLAFEELVVGDEALGGLGAEHATGAVGQRHAQRVGHLGGDVGLHLEDIGERGVELLRPAGAGRLTRARVHQLGCDADAAPAGGLLPADGAREEIVGAELVGDGGGPLGRPAVLERAAARDHLEPADLGQLGPDLVGHAIGEVGVGGIPQVLEREHGDDAGPGIRTTGSRMGPPPGEEAADAEEKHCSEADGGAGLRRRIEGAVGGGSGVAGAARPSAGAPLRRRSWSSPRP